MTTDHPPLVSVITPVYNGEKYLPECIESIMAQSYQNWEYVIVNNCSTDNSLEIAESYSRKEPRIKIFTNSTLLPALKNFNQMLKRIASEAKYCKIVHADDWIFPECLAQMVQTCEKNPSVGIAGSYRLVGKLIKSTGLPYNRTLIPGHEMARMNLLSGPYTFGTPSALLIRSDLIRARAEFYNESHPGADTEVCYELLKECDFAFVHQILSYSRVHEESITRSISSLNARIPNSFYSFVQFGPFFLSKGEYERTLSKRIHSYYLFLGSNILHLKDKKFWGFHKKWLNKLGFRLNWFKVFLSALYLSAKKMIDIKGNIKYICKILKTN